MSEELKDFFASLGNLEGYSEEEIGEMSEYLGVPQEVEEDPNNLFMTTLRKMGNLTEADLLEMHSYLSEEDKKVIGTNLLEEGNAETEEVQGDIRAQISKMNLPQKVKVAMFGNATCRAILVLNGNKLIQMAVLKNPKIQEKEISEYVKNPNISKEIIRAISQNRQWMKSYGIKVSIVKNPKTPIDLSIQWLKFLNKVDMKKISRSKGIPSALVTQAKKRLELMQRKA